MFLSLLSGEVPENIRQLSHGVGEFPVLFFGTHEYAWINQGRCFSYQDGDSEKGLSSTNSNSQLNAAFQKGLEEAAEAFGKKKAADEARKIKKVTDDAKGGGITIKPSQYKQIKTNRPVGNCPVIVDDRHVVQACDCDPDGPNPCGKDSDCINRTLLVECRANVCKAGDKCGNRQFQKQVYPGNAASLLSLIF